MAAEHVVITFTTDSKQLANTMAAEATDAEFSCCAHIEGPIKRVHRWHGRMHATEQWRVEVEAPAEGAEALVHHINAHHGNEVHDLVTHIVAEATD